MYEPDEQLCLDFTESYGGELANSAIIWDKVSFRLSPHPYECNLVTIVNIETDKRFRGQGHGTRLMTQLCKYFDDKKLTCIVYPEPYSSDMSLLKLRKWYKQFGFKPYTNGLMIRR